MTRIMSFSAFTFLALVVVLTSGVAAQPAAHVLPKVAKATVNAPVTLADNGDSWTLDNGIIKATVPKRDGNLSSLVYYLHLRLKFHQSAGTEKQGEALSHEGCSCSPPQRSQSRDADARVVL